MIILLRLMDPASANEANTPLSANNQNEVSHTDILMRGLCQDPDPQRDSTQTNTKQNKEDNKNGNHQENRQHQRC